MCSDSRVGRLLRECAFCGQFAVHYSVQNRNKLFITFCIVTVIISIIIVVFVVIFVVMMMIMMMIMMMVMMIVLLLLRW